MVNRAEGEQTFEQRLERIETLIETLQGAPNPAVRNSAEELVETLLELHGAGFERMLELIWDTGETGQHLIHEQLVADELTGSLLLLHGLHPLGLEARVQQALEKVRPYLDSHGGNIELMGVREGIVRLRLQGNCESCPASAMTLKLAVEDAIYKTAPDVMDIETVDEIDDTEASAPPSVHGPGATNGANGAAAAGDWHDVKGLPSLQKGTVHTEQVAGRPVLFCRLNGDLYAYDSTCPSCYQPLEAARVEDTVLRCPHCGQAYDVIQAGRGRDAADLNLSPFPLLVEQDRVRVALPEQKPEIP